MGIIIRNTTVLTQDASRSVKKNCDVLIEGNQIEQVAPHIKEKAEFEIDGKGKLAMPGLVNSHTHLAMTLFRGFADDMEFFEAWKKFIWPAEKNLTARDVLVGSRLGLLEMVRSGTTSFLDMYFFVEQTATACEEIGVRGVITPAFFEDKFENGSWKKTISNLPKPTELVTYGISPHAPYTVKEYGYSECEGYSKANDCVLHTHVSETQKEVSDIAKERGMGPVEWLDSIGVLSPRMVAAHCVWADQKEIELLGKRGVSVAHCPVSNMKLASGLAPVPELVAAGANVCLGTDGSASNNSLNMLDTIKICSLAHKNTRLDPHIIPAQQALDFATRNGAKALRIDSGSIEEGKLADIVLIDLTAPNLAPGRGYASLVAYSADPSNVHTVIINGKIVLENREFVGIDEEKIVDDAIEAASGLKTE